MHLISTVVALLAIVCFYVARDLLLNGVVELFKAILRLADRILTYFAKSIWNLIRKQKQTDGPLPHDENTPIEPS
jgi:hypothetical protein